MTFCFTDTIYTKPSTGGYCRIDISGKRHQSCRCTLENDKETFCKEKCDIDTDCKGYSYFSSNGKCDIYTTSKCSNITKKCSVKHNGNVGKIQHHIQKYEQGCFIKQLGENRHIVQIYINLHKYRYTRYILDI